ncbi:hypothetical protein ACFL58_00425 [Elusimicrobiota bacterium]
MAKNVKFSSESMKRGENMRNFVGKKLFFSSFIILLFFIFSAPKLNAEVSTYQIDTPTHEMLDYGSYDADFRFFTNGGVLSRFSFGVFDILNLGVGWELENFIGTQSIIISPPSMYFKVKPFEGGMVLPAIAIGYDGQGYFYDKDSGEYAQKEKGLFVVFGREIFFPYFNLNLGFNINDYQESKILSFLNFDYEIEESLMLLVELDDLGSSDDPRFNFGVRFYVAEDLAICIAGRDTISDRAAERIANIKYTGRF